MRVHSPNQSVMLPPLFHGYKAKPNNPLLRKTKSGVPEAPMSPIQHHRVKGKVKTEGEKAQASLLIRSRLAARQVRTSAGVPSVLERRMFWTVWVQQGDRKQTVIQRGQFHIKNY